MSAKQLPIYDECLSTVRVSGGTQYFELYNRIKAKLRSTGKAHVAFMGHPPAWQFAQAMCVLQQNLDVTMQFTKCNLKTPDGPRKGVVVIITEVPPSNSTELTQDMFSENTTTPSQ